MTNEFKYQSVPYHFAHCFQAQCPKSGECLRNIAAQHCTDDYFTLYIINPKCIPADTAACPHFLSTEKVRVAWGIKHLLDNVPYKIVGELKKQLISHFGRGKYYRFFRKENYLTQKDQTYIRQLFLQKGVKEEPVFEFYSDEYKWE